MNNKPIPAIIRFREKFIQDHNKGEERFLRGLFIEEFEKFLESELLNERERRTIMNEEIKKALDEIEGQLYAINARNISLRWIGMRKTPTITEISELNKMLAFIIQEIRTLKETGTLDMEKVHKEVFGEQS